MKIKHLIILFLVNCGSDTINAKAISPQPKKNAPSVAGGLLTRGQLKSDICLTFLPTTFTQSEASIPIVSNGSALNADQIKFINKKINVSDYTKVVLFDNTTSLVNEVSFIE